MPPKYELKAKERIRKASLKYAEVVRQAAQRGINEADTSNIVQHILVDVLGYDPFKDITAQFELKGHWADWAVKVDDCFHFFLEVKALGTKLREKDLFQVISYSHQRDLEWAVLTTGDIWRCYRIDRGKEPREFFEIRICDDAQSLDEKVNYLYLLSKEGYSRGLLQEYWSHAECLRPDKLARLLLSDEVLAVVRRGVHKDSPGKRIEIHDLREAIMRGVIRGDLGDLISREVTEPKPRRRSIARSGQTPEKIEGKAEESNTVET